MRFLGCTVNTRFLGQASLWVSFIKFWLYHIDWTTHPTIQSCLKCIEKKCPLWSGPDCGLGYLHGVLVYVDPEVVWLVALRINVDLAIFQPYLDLEAGDNQSLKIQVARPGIEPRSSCSASKELNHSATTAPMPTPRVYLQWNWANLHFTPVITMMKSAMYETVLFLFFNKYKHNTNEFL